MSALLLDGKALATRLRAGLAQVVGRLGHAPGLANVLVGDNPASALYVQNKLKGCAEVGISGRLVQLPASASQGQLIETVQELNADSAVHGILLQLPLPKALDEQELVGLISSEKDVDGLGPLNYGRLAAGLPAHIPCTPLGALHLIKTATPHLAGRRAVVLGRSRLVGRPMAELLLRENCTVTLAHSKTTDLPAVTREADILVAAVGQPGLVKADWVKPGAIVIDVGINRVNGKVVGDVDFTAVREVAGAISPVPGGVGPMTVTMLLANTVRAAYWQADLSLPQELAA